MDVLKSSEVKAGAIVILSGGLDSLVSLYLVRKTQNVALALTFDYGQKAALRERQVAQYHCRRLGIRHEILELPWLKRIGTSSLQSGDIPVGDKVDIGNFEVSKQTAKSVWVPNRNGLFIEVAACYADALGLRPIVVGFNAEEAATFPDNSAAFVEAINQSLKFSTQGRAQVYAPVINLTKLEIAALAKELFPWHELWSCYQDGERLCGICESCQRLRRAITHSGGDWEDYVTRNEIFIRSLRSV